jgi:nucleotide-binding universal stress UspA family protein
MRFTHVLVPTDFSEAARHALQYAIEEATLHHAKMTLLHVLPPHSGTDVYYVTGFREAPREGSSGPVAGSLFDAGPPSEAGVVRRDLDEEALEQLRDLVPDTFHGTWEADVASGNAADTIVRIAQDRNADLIVMATHGRTGFQHALLGSVAEKVVRLAPCPVLTIRKSTAHDV